MAGKYSKIRSALVQQLVTVLPTLYPVSYENRILDPGDGKAWVKLSLLRSPAVVASLGAGGLDRHDGILQVDLNYPLGTGDHQGLEDAALIEAAFTAGQRLEYDGMVVVVTNCALSPAREVGNFHRLTLSIFWYSFVTRG
jgi:hypothetical protein